MFSELRTHCRAPTCDYERVRLKAACSIISLGLPASCPAVPTVFHMPEAWDYHDLPNAAHITSTSVVPGKGCSGGTIILGWAESIGASRRCGFDWSEAAGAGQSWVENHSTRKSKSREL